MKQKFEELGFLLVVAAYFVAGCATALITRDNRPDLATYQTKFNPKDFRVEIIPYKHKYSVRYSLNKGRTWYKLMAAFPPINPDGDWGWDYFITPIAWEVPNILNYADVRQYEYQQAELYILGNSATRKNRKQK